MKTIITLVALMAATAALAGEDQSPWDITLGMQVRHQPHYLGSEAKSAHLLPLVRVSYTTDYGSLRLGTLPGADAPLLSYSPLETGNAALGIAIGVDPGRSETDARALLPGSTRLKGMGNLPGTSVVALFGSYRMQDITVHGMYRSAIDANTGHGGQLGSLHMAYALPMSGLLSASLQAGVTWANQQYMQNMFGVTAQQSADTGFAVHAPGSGVRDYTLGLDMRYRLEKNVMLLGGLGLTRLASAAASSPIVQDPAQPHLYVGAVYHW